MAGRARQPVGVAQKPHLKRRPAVSAHASVTLGAPPEAHQEAQAGKGQDEAEDKRHALVSTPAENR
jgi:hypothetical protein